MEQGARDKAKEMGVAIEVNGIESESDADKQADLVRIMLNRGVDAIVIAPASSVGIVTPLMRAQQAKIPVINIDNRISKEEAAKQGLKPATFIGPDNADGAKKVAACACKLIKKKAGEGKTAKVLILRGIDGVENAEARRAGAGDDRVEVACLGGLHPGGGRFSGAEERGRRATAAMLSANPDVLGILCANDKMALGAIAAVKSRGKIGEIIIVGYDNIDLARDAIKRGEMQATVEQNPAMMGALGVESAVKALNGASLPEVTPVPTQLITADDLTGAKPAETKANSSDKSPPRSSGGG